MKKSKLEKEMLTCAAGCGVKLDYKINPIIPVVSGFLLGLTLMGIGYIFQNPGYVQEVTNYIKSIVN